MSRPNPKTSPPRWTASNSEGFVSPAALAVDVVLLTVRAGVLETIVVEREQRQEWLPGELALPGGFVKPAEGSEGAARRILQEKAGIANIYLEQLAAFTDPSRDPRGWIPSIAYLALVPTETEPAEREKARWVAAREAPRLVWDHNEILIAALDRVEGKLWWSNVAVGILPGPFTLSQARGVYEAIADKEYDPSTFARDLQGTGLVTRTDAEERHTGGRPAQLYKFVAATPTWGEGRRKRIGAST